MSAVTEDTTTFKERAHEVLGSVNLATASYLEIVSVLTTVRYVADLCIKEIEDRGLIHFDGDVPEIPDCRPQECFIEHALTREESKKATIVRAVRELGLLDD